MSISPRQLKAAEHSSKHLSTPGLTLEVLSTSEHLVTPEKTPVLLTLRCLSGSEGDVSIGIKCAPGVVGPAEADIDFDIIKNDNDTFTVKYTPPGSGRYTIMVLFADQVSTVSTTPLMPSSHQVEEWTRHLHELHL